MKKTKNVKATDLMVDDHIKIGGNMYRVTSLSLGYGRRKKFDNVKIHMHSVDDKRSYITLSYVKTRTLFTIYNQ